MGNELPDAFVEEYGDLLDFSQVGCRRGRARAHARTAAADRAASRQLRLAANRTPQTRRLSCLHHSHIIPPNVDDCAPRVFAASTHALPWVAPPRTTGGPFARGARGAATPPPPHAPTIA
eukprot:1526040-Prymnesium_polylepis.1